MSKVRSYACEEHGHLGADCQKSSQASGSSPGKCGHMGKSKGSAEGKGQAKGRASGKGRGGKGTEGSQGGKVRKEGCTSSSSNRKSNRDCRRSCRDSWWGGASAAWVVEELVGSGW